MMNDPDPYESLSPFGKFRIQLDPWAPEYGAETPVTFEPPDEAADVDMGVECSPATWAPVEPRRADEAPTLAFIDGVRRMEARLVATVDGKFVHGAAGSYAVGAVRASNGPAFFAELVRGRVIILANGKILPNSVVVGPGLTYVPRSVPEADPDAPLMGLHREMRAVEGQLARELAQEENLLVIADGPLNFGDATPGRVVGFVKRLFKLYVPDAQQSVLRLLSCGTRTPVFLIRSAGRFSRYAWFTRVGPRLAMESDFTGLVRLEVSDNVAVDEVIRLADLTTAVLPGYVPSRSRDPRAPQNLVPIGALEQHLRHALGDARLIHRRLATLLAREHAHV